jgi:MFS transporter, ACS family, glucarate transporter
MMTTTTLVFSVGILDAFLFGIISDRLIKIKGTSFTRKSVAGVSFMGMVTVIFLFTYTMNHLPVTISLVVADFCMIFIVLTCFSTCINIGGDRVSTISGFMNFIGQAGLFLMFMTFGAIVDLTHNYETPQYLMLALLFAGGVCWLGIDASKKTLENPFFRLLFLLLEWFNSAR